MRPSFRQLFLTSSVVASLVVPQMTAAASSQELLNQALERMHAQGASRLDMDMSFHIDHKPVNTTQQMTSVALHSTLSARNVRVSEHEKDGEGRFVIDQIDVSRGGESSAYHMSAPIVVDWKTVNPSDYVQVTSLPSEMADGLKKAGFDPAALLSQWVRFDPETIENLSGTHAISTSEMLDFSTMQSVTNPLQVIGTEGTEQRANGDVITKLQVRVNPQLLDRFVDIQIKSIPAQAPDRNAQISAIRQGYYQMRSALEQMKMAATVNQTTMSLERLDIDWQATLPDRTCVTDYSDTDANGSGTTHRTCSVTSNDVVSLKLGVAFKPAEATPVIPPASSWSFTDVLRHLGLQK